MLLVAGLATVLAAAIDEPPRRIGGRLRPGGPIDPGWHEDRTIRYDGSERWFRYYVPWEGGSIPGDRGTVASVAETLALWLGVNRHEPDPDHEWSVPDLDPDDGCTVRGSRWQATGEGGEVLLLTVDGGGHTMPSRLHRVPRWILILFGFGNQNHDIEGAREAWDFLSRQRLDS
jgi:poly(3-hydroxybutyrate) depolymerase